MSEQQTNPTEAKPEPVKLGPTPAGMTRVRVRTTQANGRRRIGRHFGQEWSTFDVTDDELKALRADPLLAVEAQGSGAGSELDEARKEIERLQARVRELEGKLTADDPRRQIPEEQKIHPLGDNLMVPPVTVPDTSAKAEADREETRRKEREQAERAAEAAKRAGGPVDVRVVEVAPQPPVERPEGGRRDRR